LMLHGAEDRRVTRAQLRSIHDNLPHERELHFLERLGRQSYVVKRLEEWKDWVGRYLGK
jgi:hypothetical protein